MENESRSHKRGGIGGTGNDARRVPAVSASFTIAELAQETGVTVRALRFYQSKGLLPRRKGQAALFSQDDRNSVEFILRGKRLGFTLAEIREMLDARTRGVVGPLPVTRKKCSEQIKLLEQQRNDIERALAELRQIYVDMFGIAEAPREAGTTPEGER
jgi:DNA-binding transcriptional MerR regulator